MYNVSKYPDFVVPETKEDLQQPSPQSSRRQSQHTTPTLLEIDNEDIVMAAEMPHIDEQELKRQFIQAQLNLQASNQEELLSSTPQITPEQQRSAQAESAPSQDLFEMSARKEGQEEPIMIRTDGQPITGILSPISGPKTSEQRLPSNDLSQEEFVTLTTCYLEQTTFPGMMSHPNYTPGIRFSTPNDAKIHFTDNQYYCHYLWDKGVTPKITLVNTCITPDGEIKPTDAYEERLREAENRVAQLEGVQATNQQLLHSISEGVIDLNDSQTRSADNIAAIRTDARQQIAEAHHDAYNLARLAFSDLLNFQSEQRRVTSTQQIAQFDSMQHTIASLSRTVCQRVSRQDREKTIYDVAYLIAFTLLAYKILDMIAKATGLS